MNTETTELTPSINVNDPFQSALQSTITRRSFLKRTAATVLLTVMALNTFAGETTAVIGGGSSVPIYSIKLTQADVYAGGPGHATTWTHLIANDERIVVELIAEGIVIADVGKTSNSWSGTVKIKGWHQEYKTTTSAGGATLTAWTTIGDHVIEQTVTFTATLPDKYVPKMNLTGGGGDQGGKGDFKLGSQVVLPNPATDIGGGTVVVNAMAGMNNDGGLKGIGVQIGPVALTWEAGVGDHPNSKTLSFGFSVVRIN